jgi:hypothetical protein
VESLLDAIHDLAKVFGDPADVERVTRLESEVARLRDEVRELRAPSLGAASRSDEDLVRQLPPGSAGRGIAAVGGDDSIGR